MKKNYQKPAMREVRIQHSGIICGSNTGMTTVTKTSNNAELNEVISAGSGDARSRTFDAWDDEDEE